MKFALILALATSASAWTFVSEEWPNVKNWAKKPVSKLYDLTAEQNNALESIPKIDVTLEVPRNECPTDATPEKYGKAGSCWWSCQTEGPKCLRDTDISVCKKDHYGLIFADGVTEHTAKILDLLKARNHKATFCLIGARLVQQQALARRIVDEGHDLCMHTWSHWPMTNMDSKTVMSDILWTAKAFKDVLGVEPSLILPPHGSLDDRVREIIKTLGYTALMWNFSVKDTRLAAKNKVTGDELLDRKYADIATIKDDFTASYQKEYPNGIISLHHDSFEESLEYATFVLDTIVPKYKVVPVSECLGRSVWKSAPGELPVPDSNPSTSSSTPPNPNAVEQTGSAPITAASGLLAAIASAGTVSMMV